ncbi:MAG TPA: SRPBCC family protein [Propionibacteriaceae bacterium]|nr:SRPBCC family protein [Propionibacteriaceae bacterium]
MPRADLVEASRLISASAAEIFELLAHPAQHALIDGSGTVKGVQERTPLRLSAGARFGMQMQWGRRYKILNEVVEFEEGRRIAWRHFGGHVWRYILEPVGERSTQVTEQFDPAGAKSPLLLRLIRAGQRNRASIEETLSRIERWARDTQPR